ncbi:hypothetical protein I3843_10G102200 [Carya illinoinensis]|uniref:Uncharacterized protein n=1 Tax=Carya illinoinensis TaxID=32201 RepID=A0A8T1PEK6_CARIL|nr:uncharacterized protein LOC122280051 [Carya illinoinensis]KAG6639527.1 hypothetical protein CIPAW_10G107100 [Carya illinoinensis]KAG6692271.1 hypothetical protein I3842_10G106600 [Carya illinoinensis]KAG7960049.1 hypothetical protein I3843_10G102200 [Carya illinoinensis]
MAKSMRCKREKRLRAIRREIVEPFYDNKDAAKLAAQEAALAAPKLPVRPSPNSTAAMDLTTTTNKTDISSTASIFSVNAMDVEMADGNQSIGSLKPVGGIGKKSKRKFKVGKGKRRGKGLRRKRHI